MAPLIVAAPGTSLSTKQLQERVLEAAVQGNLESLKDYFPEGCECRKVANAKNGDGRTALHLATIKGHFETVKYLFEKGTDLFAVDNNGDLAIHLAARLGKYKIIEFFLQHMDQDTRTHQGDWTPLHCTAWKGHIDVARHLLAQRADVNARDYNKDTPLHWAARYGQLEVVRLLVQRGADVNSPNNDGDTAFHYAAANGKLEVFRYLMENRGRINARNITGDMAIHWAAKGGSLSMVEYLIQEGVDPDTRGEHDWTALQRAAWRGKLDVVKSLIEKGASLNLRDTNGMTALHWAVDGRRADTVKYLIASGADVSITAINGKTAREWPETDKLITELFDQVVHRNARVAGKESPDSQTAAFLLSEEQTNICNREAYVTYFLNHEIEPSKLSVYDLIYRHEVKTKSKFQQEANRWIHLPLNHTKWVLDLIDRLCYMDNKEAHRKGIKSFVTRNMRERVAEVREACCRESHFQWERAPIQESTESHGLSMISAVLPYFDIESPTSLAKFKDQQKDLLEKCSELYSSPTLDRSYYVGLCDTQERDRDQVLTKMLKLRVQRSNGQKNRPNPSGPDTGENGRPQFRSEDNKELLVRNSQSISAKDDNDVVDETKKYVSPAREIQEENSDASRLLMVPQLWMWIIDKRTIITACPERLHSGDKSANTTLFKIMKRSLDDALGLEESLSPEEFVIVVLQSCIRFFNDPINAGLNNPASSEFAGYLSEQAAKEARYRKDFFDSLQSKEASPKTKQALKDITREIECLKEVKDIRDEVNMVENILENQFEVSEAAISSFKQSGVMKKRHDFPALARLECDQTIHTLRRRWKRLGEDAGRVEKSLNHLLDLKQKQANLDEAAAAAASAKSAAVLNKAIIVFTVVTVIFTPMSFVTSLYALDYFKPPEGTNSRTSGWDQRNIGSALGVAEAVTIALLILIISYFSLRMKIQMSDSAKSPAFASEAHHHKRRRFYICGKPSVDPYDYV